MKQITKVKGISLIVLVITIIIIIILAGAVILSLSNSNVINKAKAGVMQTDLSTVKEQIKTKMAEDELNGTTIEKIGTQLWDSYYTLSVSQLQEIGITTKNDYIYNYNTGDLSVKQNNEYVTPEEIYPTDAQGASIEGYLGIKGLEVAPNLPLSKQTMTNNYTNGEIKVRLVSRAVAIDTMTEAQLTAFFESIKTPIYITKTNNAGYFRLENITPGEYTLVIQNDINILPFIRNITVSANQAKVISTRTSPIRLYTGDVVQDDFMIDGSDMGYYMDSELGNWTEIKKYDLNKDGLINVSDRNFIVTTDYSIYDAITI